MKNRMKKMMMTAGILCMMSLAVYGCGKSEAAANISEEEKTEEPEKADLSKEASGQSEEKEEIKTTSWDSCQMELSGDIQEIGDMQFTVSEIITSEGEDGVQIAISVTDESKMNLITVVYNEDTYFYKRTIRNGGADFEDSDASPDDLKKGGTAEMKGTYEGEVFHASEIQIVEVIL